MIGWSAGRRAEAEAFKRLRTDDDEGDPDESFTFDSCDGCDECDPTAGMWVAYDERHKQKPLSATVEERLGN